MALKNGVDIIAAKPCLSDNGIRDAVFFRCLVQLNGLGDGIGFLVFRFHMD